ncbi:DUF3089 domain-containing protein [Sphingomonas sp. BN140010]|uniref:DUF3089 domain-containing protein n=1 Tax=Sphingomonas arvum TaxID=2992113 RepID=A0ABT3JF50_9SPHN|nr:DUF3089 domain-containing protein [Sphingomonas sp. BN140010]MCW3797395.1 DUF3089 domain-containing protein [Sphingomonas sp. BN140010]
MCVRRFLLAVFVLILLFVAGAFAVYQFGSSFLVKQAAPSGHFEAPPAQTGPDYVQTENWLSLPDTVPPGPAEWLPAGIAAPEGARPVAVFYVHPTTYLQKDRWNAPLSDPESQNRATLFVRSQASAFNGVGQVYAPKYRQAAFGAFLLRSEDAQKALDLAYSDVARAFDRFLAQVPEGPIILAGHSQGALHLTRLLRDKVAGKPVATRVVAAYVGGWPVSVAADLPAMGLAACERPDQARCVTSWQSYGEPANTQLVTDVYDGSTGFTGQPRRREDMLCVNPLTGSRNGVAPASANLGTLVPNTALTEATLQPGSVGARCDKGFLVLDGDIPSMGPYVLPGNNYHVYDYALFWANLRQDAQRRLAAWQAR